MSVRIEQTGHCIKGSGSPDCMWDGESCSYRSCDAGIVEKYVCDECDDLFVEDDMYSLGGDVAVEGFAPSAVPAVCVGCHESGGAR